MPGLERRFATESWSLLVPEGWSAQHDADGVSLFGEPGCGALQVSAAFKNDAVTDAELLDFAKERSKDSAPTPTSVGELTGFELSRVEDGTYWREWYLRSGNIALFVTYNCDSEDRGREDEAIGEILDSLSVSGKARFRRE